MREIIHIHANSRGQSRNTRVRTHENTRLWGKVGVLISGLLKIIKSSSFLLYI